MRLREREEGRGYEAERERDVDYTDFIIVTG